MQVRYSVADPDVSIVNMLKLKEGDILDWQLSVVNNKMVLIVEKDKESGKK
jgi:hypothetical protein